jgi:hypothetical protein
LVYVILTINAYVIVINIENIDPTTMMNELKVLTSFLFFSMTILITLDIIAMVHTINKTILLNITYCFFPIQQSDRQVINFVIDPINRLYDHPSVVYKNKKTI